MDDERQRFRLGRIPFFRFAHELSHFGPDELEPLLHSDVLAALLV